MAEEEEEAGMEITDDELNRLITYDEEKRKYVAVCPVEGCGKVYEIASKGFAFGNLKRHLEKEHGITVVSGAAGGTPSEEGGIFQRMNPIPEKVYELLTDYAGVDARIAKKIVELLEKNPVLTENQNNLFNFLSRAKGMDPTLAKNIVDLVFTQVAYERQMQPPSSGITPVFPSINQSNFTPVSPSSQSFTPGQTALQQPQIAYIPNPSGGMTPVIINIPPQAQQPQGQSQTQPIVNIPPQTHTGEDKYTKYLEDRVKALEAEMREKERERRGYEQPVRGEPSERVIEKIPMRKVREPIFAENEKGEIQIDEKTGKPIILDYREIEEPVLPDQATAGTQPPVPETKSDNNLASIITILKEAKGLFAPAATGTTAGTQVDEEKIQMKAVETAKSATESRIKELETEIEKIKELSTNIEKHVDGKVGEIKDAIKDLQHETQMRNIAEKTAKETYERLKPFIKTSTETPPPQGLTPQQYALGQMRQLAGDIVNNIRAGFDSIGKRIDQFVDAQKVTQMATSMLASGIPPEQVERIVFQYVRGQVTPEAVQQAATYTQGSVGGDEKEAFLNRLRQSV